MAFRRGVRRPAAKKQGGLKKKRVEYDGIIFDSNLEISMYKLLREAGIEFTYNSPTYVILPKMVYPVECFEKSKTKNGDVLKDKRAILEMKYTPDFVCVRGEWIIETKGRANESFPLRWKMFKKHAQENLTPVPMLFKPSNKTECMQVVEFLINQGYGKQEGRKD